MFFAGGSFTYPDLIHFPPRRYREPYRTESQEQARISDYTIAHEPLRSADNFGWRVTSTIAGRDMVSDITVLTWSDLVKCSMDRGVVWTYLSLIKTAWIYVSSGALCDVMKLRKGPVIAALYPVGFLIAQLCFAILCAAVLSSVLWPAHLVFGNASWEIIWPILALFQKYDGKIFAHYLMQDYAHTARHKGAYDPELSTRLDAFRHSIEGALGDGYDEVLVVGHSSGAHLGISVLARLERAGIVTPKSPIFFLAGHETSASAFAWSLYLLTENQDVQTRLAEEVQTHDLNIAGLSKMPLLRGVFRKALRLYPPEPMMVRETTCPEAFRDRTLPKGSQVVLSPWHLHRHERLWDDPDAFDPERYTTENGKSCLRDCFIPFSAGARVCPGAGFAMIEGPLLIAAILRKYRVTLTEHGRPVPVAHLTVRAKDGIWLNFQSRD